MSNGSRQPQHNSCSPCLPPGPRNSPWRWQSLGRRRAGNTKYSSGPAQFEVQGLPSLLCSIEPDPCFRTRNSSRNGCSQAPRRKQKHETCEKQMRSTRRRRTMGVSWSRSESQGRGAASVIDLYIHGFVSVVHSAPYGHRNATSHVLFLRLRDEAR